jgi:ATP-binding cassette subfamily B protein
MEIREAEGGRVQRYARSVVSDAEIWESGGMSWLIAVLKDGSKMRIGMAPVQRLGELRQAAENIRKWLGKQEEQHDGPQESSRSPAPQVTNLSGKLQKKFSTVTAFLKYIKPHRGSLAFTAVILLTVSILGVLPPYLMKFIIDGGLLAASKTSFVWLIALLMAVHLLMAVFHVLRKAIGIRVGMQIVSRIRKDMFDKLMKLPVRYYDQRKTAPFIGRIQYDTAHVEGFLTTAVPDLIAEIVMIGVVVVMLFTLHAETALLLVCLIPVCLLAARWLWPKVRALALRTWNAEYNLQQYIYEALHGIRLIKSFRQEGQERHRFDESNETALLRSAEQQRWSMWIRPGLRLAVSWTIAVVWLIGGLQVIEGRTTLGTVIAFTTYLSMFLGQMRWTMGAASRTNRVLISAERILDLLNMQEEISFREGSVRLPEARGEIRVQSVSFGYEPGRRVLHDINLHVQPGEKIGITGKTGAGKSTLIHLLCRFYDPDNGRIELDGIDLRELTEEDLRRHIGIVMQDTYLFDGTIAQNIAYGKPDATLEEIMEAARLANAHDFICRLPYGYDTRIGERGARLSGGEKQRISIARALLLNPSVLILDEATSSMDAETEREVQEALDVLCRGRTVVAIAHRLSTLRNADRIVVLENGRIAEVGSHEELKRKKGIYWRLLEANRMTPSLQEGSLQEAVT